MNVHPIEIGGLLLAAGVVGALLPLYRRWSERGLHLFVALAAGVFLGTIFLHLLPHMAGIEEHGGAAHAGHDHGGALGPWIAALCGLLLLFAIEKVWLPTVAGAASSNPHVVLWWATFVGLSLHALTAGISLSAVLDEPGGRAQLLASLLIHKATETFSLATVMRLAGLSRARMLGFLGLFVILEPAAFFFGHGLVFDMPELDSLLTGFACGTFLYVATCDLLPEVFHGRDRPSLKLVCVLAGIGVTAVTLPALETAAWFVERTWHASVDIFLDLAPYLLLGLFASGLVSLALKRLRLARKLGGNDMKSVLWAALFGAPLPLCSCSVVPIASALRKNGASKGATSAFTISTPETGVDSLAVSFVLLDPLLAIARPIGAIASAVASGAAVNAFVRAGFDAPPAAQPGAPAHVAAEGHVHAHAHDHAHGHDHAHVHAHDHVHPHRELHAAHVATMEKTKARAQTDSKLVAEAVVLGAEERGWFVRVMHYAFVEMLDDLALSLVVGVLLSGAIIAALPPDVFQSGITTGFPALILMLLIGIPFFVCALTSTPIAAALIAQGLSPGAAFVFLLAGPATNAAALVMLAKVLGKRVVLVQLVTLSVSAVALGWLIDRVYPWLGGSTPARVAEHVDHSAGPVAIVSAVVLLALLVASLARVVRGRSVAAARCETA